MHLRSRLQLGCEGTSVYQVHSASGFIGPGNSSVVVLHKKQLAPSDSASSWVRVVWTREGDEVESLRPFFPKEFLFFFFPFPRHASFPVDRYRSSPVTCPVTCGPLPNSFLPSTSFSHLQPHPHPLTHPSFSPPLISHHLQFRSNCVVGNQIHIIPTFFNQASPTALTGLGLYQYQYVTRSTQVLSQTASLSRQKSTLHPARKLVFFVPTAIGSQFLRTS